MEIAREGSLARSAAALELLRGPVARARRGSLGNIARRVAYLPAEAVVTGVGAFLVQPLSPVISTGSERGASSLLKDV